METCQTRRTNASGPSAQVLNVRILGPSLIALLSSVSFAQSYSGTIFLDADTPPTGGLLDTQPLVHLLSVRTMQFTLALPPTVVSTA